MTDLRAYVTLPADLAQPAPGPVVARPSRVLLTGATGYLGAYLLTELLARSEATVVCLVRARDIQDGRTRLEANLARYDLTADFSRVEVLPGAMEQPGLGLDTATWQALAENIDAIVHSAASVSFLPTLEQMLPVNVGGVVNLLRLAGDTRLKTLHLASSYSVFNASSYSGVPRVFEEPLVGDGDGFRRGYPASKWIAERVGDLASARGWSVTTHRLGLLWGDARTGRSKHDDVLTLNVRACLAMGAAQDLDFLMHITPVDFAASAMAAIVMAPEHAGGYYHTVTETPITWGEFVRGMQRHGYPIELVSSAAWHERLRGVLPAHREFMPLVMGASADSKRGLHESNIFSMQFDASRLRAALAGTGITCPPLDQGLIGTYADAMAGGAPR
ncbi:MAG: thioester reductase domain-containing protein [Gemmatimonadota bacterium]